MSQTSIHTSLSVAFIICLYYLLHTHLLIPRCLFAALIPLSLVLKPGEEGSYIIHINLITLNQYSSTTWRSMYYVIQLFYLITHISFIIDLLKFISTLCLWLKVFLLLHLCYSLCIRCPVFTLYQWVTNIYFPGPFSHMCAAVQCFNEGHWLICCRTPWWIWPKQWPMQLLC